MNKKQIAMLERVWIAEVSNLLPLQTKSKVAEQLAEDGYLIYDWTMMSGAKVYGYWLSHAGRWTYCSTCEGEE